MLINLESETYFSSHKGCNFAKGYHAKPTHLNHYIRAAFTRLSLFFDQDMFMYLCY